jgi:hypothetical protein
MIYDTFLLTVLWLYVFVYSKNENDVYESKINER